MWAGATMDDQSIIHDRGRGPEIRGTRVTVYNVMDHHLAGRPATWIADFYSITVEAARGATDYIDRHLDDLMPKYRRDLDWARRGNPPQVETELAGSHERLMRLKNELDLKKTGAADARAAG
jgi:uncharacterized protein (DUF433 family)